VRIARGSAFRPLGVSYLPTGHGPCHRQIGPMPSQSRLRAGQPAHAGTGGSRHATVFAPLPQDKIARETEEF
jgi:hypothetical protein